MLNPMLKGGYAELAVLSQNSAAKVPDSLDLSVAAAIPTAGLTGVQLIEEHVCPQAGDRVLITGACGAVGRFAVYAARLLKGVHVIAGVRADQRRLALELGADEVAVLGEAWKGTPFDHVADTVGGSDVAALCRHTTVGSRIRTVATTPIDAAELHSSPEFIAVHPDARRLQELVEAVDTGQIQVEVALRLPLSEAAEAHRMVELGGLGGKVILEP
jgi:NADPH:quinone reductase-like Zn-dependent oxidoreductase